MRLTVVVPAGAIAPPSSDYERLDAGADLSEARGEWVLWLEPGDELVPDAASVVERVTATTQRDVVLAGWITASADRQEWRTMSPSATATTGVRLVRRTALPAARSATSGAAEVTSEALVVRYAGAAATPPAASPRGHVHGVLVTYGRPESLARIVAQLAGEGISTLTVVDNAPSAESKAAALSSSDALPTTYLPMPENTGPAGGIAAGMTHVLEHAPPEDWVVTLDDDRLTGTPGAIGRLRDLGEWLAARGAPVGALGLVGARFDRRRGRLLRPSDGELAGPLTVDYVAGNQLPTIRVAAIREVGPFDRRLFFGFDDLDFCLRLRAHGYRVYADGRETMLARIRFGRSGTDVGAPPRRVNPWRRYYAVRNHIVVMMRYVSRPRAVVLTFAQLFGRPVTDVRNRRGDSGALALAGLRGSVDAWTGRLGRRFEPPAGGEPAPTPH